MRCINHIDFSQLTPSEKNQVEILYAGFRMARGRCVLIPIQSTEGGRSEGNTKEDTSSHRRITGS